MKTSSTIAVIASAWIFCLGSLCASTVSGQGASKSVKVYRPGKHILSPELLPIDFSSLQDPTCSGQLTDDAQFAVIVDPMGQPRNIIATRPAMSGLAPLAAEIAARDRFSAGQRGDATVAVSITIDIHLEGCITSERGTNHESSARLAKPPIQRIGPPSNLEPETLNFEAISSRSARSENGASAKPGGAITAPVPVYTPEASYTPEAKKKRIQGVCLVSLIVDANGVPQSPRVIKSLGYGLDEAAMDAVKTYRFKPATKDGNPVPVMMTVQVDFRLK